MAVLKCKMCGGDIIAVEGQTYGVCDCCGSTVTLPRVNDQRMENLFNRANHFRLAGEFDKAVATYEMILNEDDANAEAHWGLLLARCGIEYVEDPASHERIPTCHRIQSDPVLSDGDYQAALRYAPDEHTRSLYEAEGKRLAELQRGLLQVSAQAEPFDIFICYKETDTDGKTRTRDSALAQDIYYHLTDAGYRVFFSRVTLENMLGQKYEPHIFAALNSAKVMLVLGTKPEYFDAVWVRNEWSRFLAMSRKDRSKALIPCYRDMNVYDLPDELSMLQSLDMSRIGFMQDLLRGIGKIVKSRKKGDEKRPESGRSDVNALYRRAQIYLEDGDFDTAAEYFNRILDINPEYAPAYMGKVQAALKVRREQDLEKQPKPFDDNRNYQHAVHFAAPELKAVYERYCTAIRSRNEAERARQEKAQAEETRKESLYQEAVNLWNHSFTAADYESAALAFERVNDYRDAADRARKCRSQAEVLRKEEKRVESEEAAKRQAASRRAEEEQLMARNLKRRKARRRRTVFFLILLIAIAAAAAGVKVGYIELPSELVREFPALEYLLPEKPESGTTIMEFLAPVTNH